MTASVRSTSLARTFSGGGGSSGRRMEMENGKW